MNIEPQREILINLATSKPEYKTLCRRVNPDYADDIFQEVCVEILTMRQDKLPQINYFNFWFYRVAYNTMSPTGKLGWIVNKNRCHVGPAPTDTHEPTIEDMIKEAERFMLSLNEFENRVVLLYNQYGNMKKVQKETGISYSALRQVKNKLISVRCA